MVDKVVKIRPGTVEDAQRISALATELARKFVVPEFTPDGAAKFLKLLEVEPTAKRLAASDEFRFLVAEDGAAIVGVAAMQGGSHVYHLFVARGYERAGLTRKLWKLLKEDALSLGTPREFTINASRYAVAAYTRLGFRLEGEMVTKDGVCFHRMTLPVRGPARPSARH